MNNKEMDSEPMLEPLDNAEPVTPVISVILCVRNGAETILEQLMALTAQDCTRAWELVVVNNGSTDDTLPVVQKWQAQQSGFDVVIVDGSAVSGLSAARNLGVQQARGYFLLFCDADDIVDHQWVMALADALGEADLVGGPLDLHHLNTPALVHLRRNFAVDSSAALPLIWSAYPYVIGANMGVRREMYQRLGGCDPRLVICGDDVDLSLRVAAAGGRVAFAPTARIHYRYRTTLPQLRRQMYNYGRGEALLRLKHAPALAVPPLVLSTEWHIFRWLCTNFFHIFSRDEPKKAEWLQLTAYRYGLWSVLGKNFLHLK